MHDPFILQQCQTNKVVVLVVQSNADRQNSDLARSPQTVSSALSIDSWRSLMYAIIL